MAKRIKNNKDEVYTLKGVEQLFDTMSESEKISELVSLDDIVLPKSQPRRFFEPQAMADLTQSIRKQGILSPLLVRPLTNHQYELVAGERRLRAAKEAGLEKVPVVVRELSALESKELALVENLQREDLNPVEETEGILSLLALQENLTVEEVISRLYRLYNERKGNVEQSNPNVWVRDFENSVIDIFDSLGRISWESFVKTRLPLLKLPQNILEVLLQGKIEYTKAQEIARIKTDAKRQEILQTAIEQKLSIREIKSLVSEALIAEKKPKKSESQPSLKTRMSKAWTSAQQQKLWNSPEKKAKLEKLVEQLEKLVSESN